MRVEGLLVFNNFITIIVPIPNNYKTGIEEKYVLKNTILLNNNKNCYKMRNKYIFQQ